MATLQSVTGLARLYLDDIDADVFDDATLLGHINSAYRLLLQALGVNEGPSTRKMATAEILAGESTPDPLTQLPTDMWVPLQLWEKQAGTTDDYYVLMQGPLHILPLTASAETLRYWKYEANTIGFIPATRDNTIQIQYVNTLAPLMLPTSVILIPYAEDYLAWMAAGYCARARGSADYANDCTRFAQAHLEAILKGNVMVNQRKNYRARSYGRRH